MIGNLPNKSIVLRASHLLNKSNKTFETDTNDSSFIGLKFSGLRVIPSRQSLNLKETTDSYGMIDLKKAIKLNENLYMNSAAVKNSK